MKLMLFSLVAFLCISSIPGQAETVRVSLEWLEFDCQQCPDLVKQYQPDRDREVVTESSHPSVVTLKQNRFKRVLVNHVERIESGDNTKQTTRINDTTFELSLAVNNAEQGTYKVAVITSLKRGPRLDASIKPGSQLTAEQMKGVSSSSLSVTFELAHGESFVSGGLLRRATHPKRSSLLNDLAGIIGMKEESSPKMMMLIIGLKESE
ncbi:MAG: hypothetical protein ABGX16_13970 [Pirellulales bacterium]